MKPKLSLVSALLAGAMAFSLAGCAGGEPGGATPASASGAAEATAAPADAVPQGRWVESTIDTLPQNLYLGDPPARLDDGNLVAYGRDETTDPTEVVRLTSADNGATWQTEPLDWAAQTGGNFGVSAVRGDGACVFFTYVGRSPEERQTRAWLAAPDGTLTELSLPGQIEGLYAFASLAFVDENTLALAPISTEPGMLPGDLLFYDLETRQITAWVTLPAQEGGDMVISTRTSDVQAMLPAADADGTPFLYVTNSAGDLLRVDTDGTLATAQAGFLASPYGSAIALAPDGAVCYADTTGIYRQAPGGGLTEQVVEGAGTSFSLESNYIVGLSVAADGSYLVMLLDDAGQSRLYRYSFDETLAAATEAIEVWSLNENATVRAAIQTFTREHPECAVNYEVALGEDATLTRDDALRTLNTELLAGEGPDVLILDEANADDFIASGLLADLSDTVDTGALYPFVAEGYVQEDGSVPLLPARFGVPLVHGAAGSLDGVSTLEDIAALIKARPPRPDDDSWAPLSEEERYAFGFESLDDLVSFGLQTSQPALLGESGLDEDALRSLLGFYQEVGSYYELGTLDVVSGTASEFGGVDTVTWGAGMAEYALTPRAVYGYGTMTTPGWLGATSPDQDASGQTILQPGLSAGCYLPSCLTAVSANSDEPELAKAFAAVLFGDEVQGSYQYDGLPVTTAGMQVSLDRNLAAMQQNGYTGGLEELLGQLSTPVALDADLLASLTEHTAAMIEGRETLDEAVGAVQDDLALRFAERQ